ncbi:unnamed protein product [Amoebophrya sp. A120]|nr:unnamed protein product [Amoebophrya sp. A120]|eukprot:GSA120T00020254001.1
MASSSPGPAREPRSRALLVGCNYPMRTAYLHGAVADAFWLATVLKDSFLFDEIKILHDHDVKRPKTRSAWNPNADTMPTRENILRHLQWLVEGSECGDCLVFFFSGFGVLVDDVTGYEHEGLQEALLATDEYQEQGLVLLQEVQDIVMNIAPGVHLTCFLDCDHALTLVDPVCGQTARSSASSSSNTNSTLCHHRQYPPPHALPGSSTGFASSTIADILTKKTALCGLVSVGYAEQRIQLPNENYGGHNPHVWNNEYCKRQLQKVKPKYARRMDVDLTHDFKQDRDTTPFRRRNYLRRAAPFVFSYCAASFGQTALELHFADVGREHGVFTYCLVKALEKIQIFWRKTTTSGTAASAQSAADHKTTVTAGGRGLVQHQHGSPSPASKLRSKKAKPQEFQIAGKRNYEARDATHADLYDAIRFEMDELRRKLIPTLDQEPVLTCTKPWCDENKMMVLQPLTAEMLPRTMNATMRKQVLRFFGVSESDFLASSDSGFPRGLGAVDGKEQDASIFSWLYELLAGGSSHTQSQLDTSDTGKMDITAKRPTGGTPRDSASLAPSDEDEEAIPDERAAGLKTTHESVLPSSFFPEAAKEHSLAIFNFEPPQPLVSSLSSQGDVYNRRTFTAVEPDQQMPETASSAPSEGYYVWNNYGGGGPAAPVSARGTNGDLMAGYPNLFYTAGASGGGKTAGSAFASSTAPQSQPPVVGTTTWRASAGTHSQGPPEGATAFETTSSASSASAGFMQPPTFAFHSTNLLKSASKQGSGGANPGSAMNLPGLNTIATSSSGTLNSSATVGIKPVMPLSAVGMKLSTTSLAEAPKLSSRIAPMQMPTLKVFRS